MKSRLYVAVCVVAVTGASLTAAGCATTAHYPTRELEDGEVMTSGTIHALSYGTLQLLYGFGTGDAGLHGGLEQQGAPTGRRQPFPTFAVGGSYRHYLSDSMRLAGELTYHRAPYRLRRQHLPVQCVPYDTSGAILRDLSSECFVADDWLKTRWVLQFAGDWSWGAVHGGPLARTGVWIADSGRRELDRSAQILELQDDNAAGREGGWTGFQFGVTYGVAWYATDWLTLQVDAQVLAPVARWIAPSVTSDDREFADPAETFMERNVFRTSFSVQVAF